MSIWSTPSSIAASELAIDLKASYVVGDSQRDIEAGASLGCFTVIVGEGAGDGADARAPGLPEAADLILEREGSRARRPPGR